MKKFCEIFTPNFFFGQNFDENSNPSFEIKYHLKKKYGNE